MQKETALKEIPYEEKGTNTTKELDRTPAVLIGPGHDTNTIRQKISNSLLIASMLGMEGMKMSLLDIAETTEEARQKDIQRMNRKVWNFVNGTKEKIQPELCFITVGKTESGKYKAALVRPKDGEYITIAPQSEDYDVPERALFEAAKSLPNVPILEVKYSEDQEDKFSYPHYDKLMANEAERIKNAAIRRAKRGIKLTENAKKSELGKNKQITIRPKKRKRGKR